MTDDKTPEESAESGPTQGESVYLGNHVPKFLRFVYVAFIVWAAFYLGKFLLPDLLTWLKK